MWFMSQVTQDNANWCVVTSHFNLEEIFTWMFFFSIDFPFVIYISQQSPNIVIGVRERSCRNKYSFRSYRIIVIRNFRVVKGYFFSVFYFLKPDMVTTHLDKALWPVPFKWNGSLALLLINRVLYELTMAEWSWGSRESMYAWSCSLIFSHHIMSSRLDIYSYAMASPHLYLMLVLPHPCL